MAWSDPTTAISMASQPPAPMTAAPRRLQAIAAPSVATAVKTMATGAKAARAPPARERVTRTGAVAHPTRPRTRIQLSQAKAVAARRMRPTVVSMPCSYLRISLRVDHVSSPSDTMAMALARFVWGIGSGSTCGFDERTSSMFPGAGRVGARPGGPGGGDPGRPWGVPRWGSDWIGLTVCAGGGEPEPGGWFRNSRPRSRPGPTACRRPRTLSWSWSVTPRRWRRAAGPGRAGSAGPGGPARPARPCARWPR